jgi:hypothetical protein
VRQEPPHARRLPDHEDVERTRELASARRLAVICRAVVGETCIWLAHTRKSKPESLAIGSAHNLAANTGRQRTRALPDKMSVRTSVRRVTNRKTTPHDAFLSNSHKPRS